MCTEINEISASLGRDNEALHSLIVEFQRDCPSGDEDAGRCKIVKNAVNELVEVINNRHAHLNSLLNTLKEVILNITTQATTESTTQATSESTTQATSEPTTQTTQRHTTNGTTYTLANFQWYYEESKMNLRDIVGKTGELQELIKEFQDNSNQDDSAEDQVNSVMEELFAMKAYSNALLAEGLSSSLPPLLR